MSIYFNRVQRKNPRDPSAPMKWYAVLKSLGLKREKEISILAADGTTLDPKEVEMAFSRFGKVMLRMLLDGHTVQIAGLGTFRLTASSEGTATKEELAAKHIKGVKLIFVPYEEVKDALKGANIVDFERL